MDNTSLLRWDSGKDPALPGTHGDGGQYFFFFFNMDCNDELATSVSDYANLAPGRGDQGSFVEVWSGLSCII